MRQVLVKTFESRDYLDKTRHFDEKMKIGTFEYQIFYDEQVTSLFQTQSFSLDPIVTWIEERILQGYLENQ